MELDKIYTELYDENQRLNKSKASSVEFITNTKYITDFLSEGAKILDIGAGTGVYSIYLADKGYDVTSVEPVKRNLECLKSKIKENMTINPFQGNALDLSMIKDDSYDLVLNMGPLYHLKSEEERIRAIQESVRVCKKGGKIFFAYISNDMVFITESLMYNSKFLGSDLYNHETMKVVDEPFTFLTVKYMNDLMRKLNLKEIKHFSSDGYAELLEEKVNALNDKQFKEWLKFHFYMCEKKEMLGSSHHIMFVTEK
ncbi:class I SAM-dependent methyltransferase [Haloplasma contractile]|uniref:Trans-aconitate 2-methyltransferase protein n=1 Tax=Haloplasma contractile SSD-17B TaxID=1033810 RepID=U2DY43_9MOLU|nr:class I SAM-dependent methyltransferase [Haloplasma contractile]ERJ13182.1 trans-aconitate 2-methyltransferase protein [Haloplasma contractile SSD-17B]